MASWVQRSLLFAPIALLALTACRSGDGGTSGAERPAGQDALLLASAKVALPPPGVSPDDLPQAGSEGARLLVRYCTACHALPSPQIHSAMDWPLVARRMWLRIDGLAHTRPVAVPASAERMVMLQYLIANALTVSGAALPAGPDRALFAATCARCHELPDPRQHAAEDWVAVVERMMQRMQTMLGDSLTPKDHDKIVQYLQSTSRQ